MFTAAASLPALDPFEQLTIDAYYRFIDPMSALYLEVLTDDFVEYEAEGTKIRNRHGREFIDGTTIGGVFGLGHRNPRVVAAVKAQLDRLPLSPKFGFNPTQAQLAELLAGITPGNLNHSFVTASGTEAIEVAMKLARLTTQRPQIISTQNSFHGMSIGCSSVSGVPYWREGFFPLLDGCTLVPFGDIEAVEKSLGPTTAAVLVEVVQSASGCTVLPPGYLTRLRELCTQHGALLIVDEIQTGFGRTGKMFAVEHEGVVPDMICLGKFMGGGVLAAGACVYGPAVQQASMAKPAYNNSTWSGNPLVCAAAIAAIHAVIEENLVEQSARLGRYLQEGLEALQRKHPMVVEIKGLGLMRTFVLAYGRQGLPLVRYLAKEEHLLLLAPIHAPTLVRVSPPQIVDEAFLDDMLARIDRGLAAVGALSSDELDQFVTDLNAAVQEKLSARYGKR